MDIKRGSGQDLRGCKVVCTVQSVTVSTYVQMFTCRYCSLHSCITFSPDSLM